MLKIPRRIGAVLTKNDRLSTMIWNIIVCSLNTYIVRCGERLRVITDFFCKAGSVAAGRTGRV